MNERTVREVWRKASSFLRQNGIDSPEFEAEYMMRRIIGLDRAHFFAGMQEDWPPALELRLDNWLKRRIQGEPLQYIVGDQAFFGRAFEVEPGVLIPRPETELLVEAVLEEGTMISADRPFHAVDVGTGSGVIAITLALEKPRWQITAIDLSAQALAVAERNARKYGVEDRILWFEGSFLEPLKREYSPIDILVSNPPYIPAGEIGMLEKTVSHYEPRLALDGGADGLDAYRAIVRQLSEWPARPRLIAFEIGADQGDEVARLFQGMENVVNIEVRQDLAGKDRIVIGRFATG
ncbi:peptide chain release factor N(5)-glutamine methyltransferase [Thermoactinomyces mirandus]|uniref:Release factor glutamine methyltransferase n=1 Tax=Thermoactinomyces mirandus TaxID=2756294 RepID=A0A7W1XTD4_9BACL|nr:peptide chain release factor N(5)-glutamine methyltransferase [Thermoactinomyces mirandus]MBA4602943.1 peptide chain release factor N(5)-glutamine methyltransferase [Thermoactinomyces mirandus]